ncbi:MAG: ABC transporter ATP-binding protein [Steroidobacteraceae bacterium]
MRVEASDVTVQIAARTIIEGVNAEVRTGEFVGIVGPNGSGKTTFLKTIYRAIRPRRGAVFIDGANLKELSLRESARRMAVMTQSASTGFDFTVQEMVLTGRTPHKKMLQGDDSTDLAIVAESLERVGMLGFIDRKFNTLSGGERQRVLVARALAQQPKILVLDEPTNHLDIHHQIQLLTLIKSLAMTTFMAMHDLNLAAQYCDRVYVMHSGKVAASGIPMDVFTPALLRDIFDVEARIVEIEDLGRSAIIFL